MLHTLKNRIVAVTTTAIVLASGLGLTVGSSTAFAASGNQYCTTGTVACLNAWNGGPFVNVYTAHGTSNNDFTLGYINSTQSYYLKYTGGGAWNGRCIGDAYNDPTINYTSLDTCPTETNSGGWGTNFTISTNCANDGFAFHNNHWNKWLKPGGSHNGDPFYFTSTTPVCFQDTNPA
ncbi:MAG TPA: hypothetical protein VLG47_07525 [Candidatus Saccharimonadales bacterium]|nr:hypothetical protein [Candidatus Saccharimonadales bacterium]